MIGEFDLPEEIVDRKVTKMKMISPSNREVDVGRTLSEKEYIGMCRREVMDDFLRKRAGKAGANIINGLFMRLEQVLFWLHLCCYMSDCFTIFLTFWRSVRGTAGFPVSAAALAGCRSSTTQWLPCCNLEHAAASSLSALLLTCMGTCWSLLV